MNHSLTLIHLFHCMALQPTVKPCPPQYICSIVWHYSPQSSLVLPNTSVPLYGTTAHSQALSSPVHLFHCMALHPTVKPSPPKYICSIAWHYSPQSSLILPCSSVPLYGTTAHSQALSSPVHLFHCMALQPTVKPCPPKYICS